jgi:hypothetical protein
MCAEFVHYELHYPDYLVQPVLSKKLKYKLAGLCKIFLLCLAGAAI